MAGKPRNGQPARAGKPSSLAEVVKTGTYREQLEALRDKLAADMDGVDSKVVAQVASQLRAVLKDIAALPDSKKVTAADDLRNRREARRAQAQALALASGDVRE